MNWEVWTMTSKTSYFDRAVFRRDVRRTAPLWILFLLVWLVVLPLPLSNYADPIKHGGSVHALIIDVQHHILSVGQIGSAVGSALYGLAAAWAVFSYLFSGKSTNFYAALPVRREGMFATHYLAGLTVHVLPMLLIAAVTAVGSVILGVPQLSACAQVFAANVLSFLFFYNFAVLCCMVVGNSILMPIIYIILNFAVPVVELMIRTILQAFVYGMPGTGGIALTAFAPAWCLLGNGSITPLLNAAGDVTAYRLTGWGYLLILAAVGVVFGVLALALYKKREMERSGDVIAVRWLRPVFLYAFTFGCALVIGVVVVSLITDGQLESNFLPTLLSLLAGTFIGYLVAQMLLQKTARVLKKSWAGLLVCCALVTLALGAVRLDLTGYARRVPDADDVASISVGRYFGDSEPVTDPDAIAQAIALHQYFVDTRGANEQLTPADSDTAWWNASIYLSYTLKDGRTVSRCYPFLCSASTAADPSSAYNRANALMRLQSVVLAMYAPNFTVTEQNILSCTLDGPIVYDEEIDGWCYNDLALSSREAAALYNSCILPDLLSGAFGASDNAYGHPEVSAAPTTEAVPSIYQEAEERLQQTSVSFVLQSPDGARRPYYYTLSSDAVRTVAYLRELGYLPE